MHDRPSRVLLQILREALEKSGANIASLSELAHLSRDRLKYILSGEEAITVDEFMILAQLLEVGLDDLQLPVEALIQESENHADEAVEVGEVEIGVEEVAGVVAKAADPYGNHTAQAVRLGFALGCDLYFVVDASRLSESGLPERVLEQFPERVPIRLDAAYHRHNNPQFTPQGLSLRLSFDELYTCIFPWDAFKQVTFFPLSSVPPMEEPEPDIEERRSHLRLVD
jgi:hypothetical protein